MISPIQHQKPTTLNQLWITTACGSRWHQRTVRVIVNLIYLPIELFNSIFLVLKQLRYTCDQPSFQKMAIHGWYVGIHTFFLPFRKLLFFDPMTLCSTSNYLSLSSRKWNIEQTLTAQTSRQWIQMPASYPVRWFAAIPHVNLKPSQSLPKRMAPLCFGASLYFIKIYLDYLKQGRGELEALYLSSILFRDGAPEFAGALQAILESISGYSLSFSPSISSFFATLFSPLDGVSYKEEGERFKQNICFGASWISKLLGFELEMIKENSELSTGIYLVLTAKNNSPKGHAMVYIKLSEDQGFLFDTNIGLVECHSKRSLFSHCQEYNPERIQLNKTNNLV